MRTFTNASTKTYTRGRLSIIQTQFRSFAKRFGYTPQFLNNVAWAIEQRLLDELVVRAVDDDGKIVAVVRLRIDWSDHDELKGIMEVTISKDWRGDVSPQIDVYLDDFEQLVADSNLRLNRGVNMSSHCMAESALLQLVLDRLGLVAGKKLSWRAAPLRSEERLSKIGEVRVGLEVADD